MEVVIILISWFIGLLLMLAFGGWLNKVLWFPLAQAIIDYWFKKKAGQ